MISWCNENQGFVSALLALSSVLVAIIALFISIKTSKKQNKIQIDLQARQLRLDSYNLRYECWRRLNNLIAELISWDTRGYEDFEMKLNSFYFLLSVNRFNIDEHKTSFEGCFCILDVMKNVLLDVIKYKFVLIEQNQSVLNELLYSILDIQHEFSNIRDKYLKITNYDELENLFLSKKNRIYELGKKIYNNINGYDKKIEKLINELENDLDISNLDKIINNS